MGYELESYETLFEVEDKVKAFDKLAELFFERNFGSASKAEIELTMFSIYMDVIIKKYSDEQNVLNYKICSDYDIAKRLGITQERVRALKVKKQARFPVDFDWRAALETVKNDVRYDEGKRKIIIPMLDPNLYNEIKHYIEQNGGYVEIQRSGNYLQIRPEYYLLLVFDSLSEREQQKMLKEVEKELSKKNKNNEMVSVQSRQDMINHILGITENALGVVVAVLEKTDSPLATVVKGIKRMILQDKG